MNHDQIRERTVICLTQPGSNDRYWLEVRSETSDDWTGLVVATMDAPAGALPAGCTVPISFPKKYWQKLTAKDFM